MQNICNKTPTLVGTRLHTHTYRKKFRKKCCFINLVNSESYFNTFFVTPKTHVVGWNQSDFTIKQKNALAKMLSFYLKCTYCETSFKELLSSCKSSWWRRRMIFIFNSVSRPDSFFTLSNKCKMDVSSPSTAPYSGPRIFTIGSLLAVNMKQNCVMCCFA